MEKGYKISIIVPVFNAEKYISRMMDSLLRQSIGFDCLQVIFVDDFSTDNSRKFLEEFESKYDNVYVAYLKENSGAAGLPRNKALSLVKADYIMFLDPDDYYDEDACNNLYCEMQNKDIDIASGYYSTVDLDEKIIENNVLQCKELEERVYSVANELDKIIEFRYHFATKIYKKSIIEKENIKFPAYILGQDSVFFIEYLLNCRNISYTNKSILYYRIRDKVDKSISNKFSSNYFQGTLKCNKLIVDLLIKKGKQGEVKLVTKGINNYYLSKLVQSNLSLEEIEAFLSQWSNIYEYLKYEDTTNQIYSTLIQEDMENKDYKNAAKLVVKVRKIVTYNEDLKKAKEWWQEQCKYKENEINCLEEQVRELQEWSTKSEEQVRELQDWAIRLEEAKQYFETNNIALSNQNNELERTKQELENELEKEQMENTKISYKYNRIMADKIINRIVKLKNLV